MVYCREGMMEVHADMVKSEPEKPLRLVVCLGNPGDRYAGTRHNAGWQAAERLLQMKQWALSKWQPLSGELFQYPFETTVVYLLKPLTYMNDSGRAVKEVLEKLGISPREILLLCDCLDLPAGMLRLRKRGSSGGQKGLESIIQILGTTQIARLRIGVGRPEPGIEDVVDYVLSPWVSAEQKKMAETFSVAAELAFTILEKGWEEAVSRLAIRTADKINASKQGEPEIGKV